MIVSALKLFILVISKHTGFNPIHSHYYVNGGLAVSSIATVKGYSRHCKPLQYRFQYFHQIGNGWPIQCILT